MHRSRFFIYAASILGFLSPPLGAVSNNFQEGGREVATLHPSCREENTGMTLVGIVLPNGPTVETTISQAGQEDQERTVSLPVSTDLLYTSNRRGTETYPANPVMGAKPSWRQNAMFAIGTVDGEVAAYGSQGDTRDTKMAFWKFRDVHRYDTDQHRIQSLPYLPAGEFITLDLGMQLPKFGTDGCIAALKVKIRQLTRCDVVDPQTHTFVAGAEPDIRSKNMTITINRNSPLPDHCGEGQTITLAPTADEVAVLQAMMEAGRPEGD